MKIQGGGPAAYQPKLDPELEALAEQFDAAFAGLTEAVQATVSAPVRVRPERRKDTYAAAAPKGGIGDEPSVSSVAPRQRLGGGVPVHELLAGASPLGAIATISDGLFAWDGKADTSIDEISTRKLLGYYEDSMTALHSSLKTFDHDRKEGLWYERYREDLWRDLDADTDYYQSFDRRSEDLHYEDMYAQQLAAEAQFQSSSYYDYEDPYR